MTTSPSVATKVAVIGSGISGAVCASALAKNGISVTIFESVEVQVAECLKEEKRPKMGGSYYSTMVLLTSLSPILRSWVLFRTGNREALLHPGMKSLDLLIALPRNFSLAMRSLTLFNHFPIVLPRPLYLHLSISSTSYFICICIVFIKCVSYNCVLWLSMIVVVGFI
nr:uncharacterized protein LOC113690882 [Coffea arabica]